MKHDKRHVKIVPGTEIYKRTATGATQVWKQEIKGHAYRTISGQLGGKLVTSAWTYCDTVNAGKKNERSGEEQAYFEVMSNYTKKLDKEYHLNPDSIDEAKKFLPMLAKDYKDYKDKLDFADGVYSQPKLDGMRCIAKADGLWSRNGKPILSTPHIWGALEEFFGKYPSLILDGELYNHEYKDDFNSIISSARMSKPSKADLDKSAATIQYHIYDAPWVDGTFEDRIEFLQRKIDKAGLHESLVIVETHRMTDHDDIDTTYAAYIEMGYEGQIIRMNESYVNKRTNALLKRKENITEEFILVDVEPGKGNWAGKAKRAILKMKNGARFAAGVTGTEEHCAAILANKRRYIGKPATVEYFALTPDGIPRFGRVKQFGREDV